MFSKSMIFDDFARGITALNCRAVSASMVVTPTGRGYLKGDKVYAQPINLYIAEESPSAHRLLQEKFRQSSQGLQGQIYAGAAGFLNLGYIGATRPSAAVLYDVNFAQIIFWQEIILRLARYEKANDFINSLASLPFELPEQIRQSLKLGRLSRIFNLNPVHALSSEEFLNPKDIIRDDNGRGKFYLPDCIKFSWHRQNLEMSWIDSDYDYVHQMARRGAIGTMALDIGDSEACYQLYRYTRNIGPVGLMYVSNILRFIAKNNDWAKREGHVLSLEQTHRNLNLLVPGGVPPQPDEDRCLPQNQDLQKLLDSRRGIIVGPEPTKQFFLPVPEDDPYASRGGCLQPALII